MNIKWIHERFKLSDLTQSPFGSPIETIKVSTEYHVNRYRYLMPVEPERDMWSVDDDGSLVFVRTRSDEELELAMDKYRLALAEYSRTGGAALKQNGQTTTVNLSFEDGSIGVAIGINDEFRWSSFSR